MTEIERLKLTKELLLKSKEEIIDMYLETQQKEHQLVGMSKSDLRANDMIEFKNGVKAFMDDRHFWIIAQYYDSDLHCITDPNYDVERVYRPEYKKIYDRAKVIFDGENRNKSR